MKRLHIVLIVIIVFIAIIVAILAEWKLFSSPKSSYSQINDVSSISNEKIAQAIKVKILEDLDINDTSIKISNKRLVKDSWIICKGTRTSTPDDDESKTMVYVLRKKSSGSLEVVAYSGDSFSENAFPEYTPLQVINEANR